jgi:hypothetical protein
MVRGPAPVCGTLKRRRGSVFACAAARHAIQGGPPLREIRSTWNDLEGTIMQRTIIAVFDNRGDAQSACDALEAAGFDRAQIRLSEGDPTGRTSSIGGAAGTGTGAHAGAGILDSIKNFFGNMFGTDDSEHVQKYSDAVTRGHHVLTMTADNEPDIERAADVVERWGPVDIDEKAAQWSGGALASEAMRAGAAPQQRAASMSQQSAQGTQEASQGAMQGSSQQGSQQYAPAADAGASIPAAQRPGVRVVEHLAEPPVEAVEAVEIDEIYFRKHYNGNYAGGGESYDDYAPAYKYGSEMANSETYRGRAWKDVEPQLRSDWEGRNPGSAWEKIKSAVRHGWERIAHGSSGASGA